MKRLVILAILAVVTPVRRGLSSVEGRLAHAEYRIRQGQGATWFVALALVAVTGCAPIQARRTLADQRDACRAAYARATSDDEARAIHERCDAAHESARIDKPEKPHVR